MTAEAVRQILRRPRRVGQRFAEVAVDVQVGGQGRRGALDQAVDHRLVRSLMQGVDAARDVGVGLGDALVVAHVIQPGRGLVFLDPDVGLGQVAQQAPLAGAVAAFWVGAVGDVGGVALRCVTLLDCWPNDFPPPMRRACASG